MALQSRTDLITFDIMAGRLLQESARRHVGQVTHRATASSSIVGSNTAFTANRILSSQGSTGRTGFIRNGRARGGYRGRFRGLQLGGGSSGSRPANPGSSGADRTRVGHGTRCHYCGKEGHWKKECYKRKSDEGSGTTGLSREFTFLAQEPVEQTPMGWVIDSGASQHLCGD